MATNLIRRISRFAGSGIRPQLFVLAILLAATAVFAHAKQTPNGVETPPVKVSATTLVPADRPRIEAVFVLDTTGSMSGLIEGAKQKIPCVMH